MAQVITSKGEMTVEQLRELLSCLHEDTVVRIMHQPSWPLVETVKGVVTQEQLEEAEAEEDDESEFEDFNAPAKPADAVPGVVYLVANGAPREGSPYGMKISWDACNRFA